MEKRTGARRRRHTSFEKGRQAAPQEKDHFSVAAVGLRDCVGRVEPFRTVAMDHLIVLPSPGLKAPARIIGKYRTREDKEKPEISPHGRSINCLGGSKSPVELM